VLLVLFDGDGGCLGVFFGGWLGFRGLMRGPPPLPPHGVWLCVWVLCCTCVPFNARAEKYYR